MTPHATIVGREAAPAVANFDHWIDGRAHVPDSGAYVDRFSPADGRLVARIACGGSFDVDLAAQAALRAQPAWAALPPVERSRLLFAVANAIRANIHELVALEVAETGKIAAFTASEFEGAAAYFEYYGALVRALHGETIDVGPDQHIFTRREPYGVIGVITPWNFSVNQGARGIAPALAAGNAVIVKPSPFAATAMLALGRIASVAGLPNGLLNVVTDSGSEAGIALVKHPAVGRVSFTGSVATGKAVAQMAAERLIPVTLELGGKAPHIIFADADLDQASSVAARAFTANAGQVCSAGTRLLVERTVHDQVVDAVVAAVSVIKVGEQMGPIITGPQFQKVKHYLEVAAEDGAHVATGGSVATEPTELARGFYVQPTVYTAVSNDMRIAREEVFGPVLSVIPFDSEDEAAAIANDTSYGLVAGLWTNDISRALRVAARLEAGQVFVNDWTANVEAPFGGYKQSGYGREKGMEALNEYTRLKSVMIRIASQVDHERGR